MGWGVLAGLGKGLGDYADIMGEKRKNDWQTQRDELNFKRDQALKQMQIDANKTANETQRTWAATEAQKGRDATVALADTKYGREEVGQYDGSPLTRQAQKEMQESGTYDQSKFTSPEAYKQKMKLEAQKDQLSFEVLKNKTIFEETQKLEQSQRQELMAQAEQSEEWATYSDAKKKDVTMQIMEPKLYKMKNSFNLTNAQKIDLVKARVNAYESGIKMWQELGMETREAYAKKNKVSMEEAVNDYATMVANRATNWQELMNGSSDMSDQGVELTAENVKSFANDIFAGKKEALARLPQISVKSQNAVAKELQRLKKVKSPPGAASNRNDGSQPPVGRTAEGYPVTGKSMKEGFSGFLQNLENKPYPDTM